MGDLSAVPLHRFDALPISLTTHVNYPDLLFFALRDGRVVSFNRQDGGVTQILDLGPEVSTSNELGLTGVTFSPDGGWLLTMSHGEDLNDRYSERFVSQVYAWELSGGTGGTGGIPTTNQSSRRLILEQPQPFGNHNGGDLTFGPDGKLYVAFGDGGSGGDPLGHGQNTSTWLGSILRIEPNLEPIATGADWDYSIPSDNPFITTDTEAAEIWIYGARNPWRISFDSATGDLWVADVGQNQFEEINRLEAAAGGGRGANLGWNEYEGNSPFASDEPALAAADHTAPVFEYRHSSDDCASVTGGYVYRGSRLAGFDGAYIYGDFCFSQIFALVPGVANLDVLTLPNSGRPISFGQDGSGELYVMTQDSWVYELHLQ